MEVKLGVSKRHVHLTQETWTKLFGDVEIEKRNDLGQPTQFASTSTVDLEWNGLVMEHVRVIGPLRSYNQIELSKTDSDFFGINPPVRHSGVLEGSLPINIIGPKGRVELSSGVIIAKRHVHVTLDFAKEHNLTDNQKVNVYKNGELLFDAEIKYSNPGALELHIDTVEGKMYNLETGEILEFEVCGK